MDDPETCHRNFDPPRRVWVPRIGTLRGIICMGTWRTLHPRRILHALDAISAHGGFLPGEPRTWALWSEAENSTE